MKLFEYYTGRTGESFERVYVWAQDRAAADVIALQAGIDMLKGAQPQAIFGSEAQAFISAPSDSGFGAILKSPEACCDSAVRTIEVMMIGSPVTIGDEVDATITGVSIREKCHVTYEVSWWDGMTHHCKWLEQHEVVRSDEAIGMRIGFTNGQG